MKIDIVQTESELKNEFEIKNNGKLIYTANLPFISINDPLDLEKLRSIKIYDKSKKEIYTTNYDYIENLKEEFIPMKFLFTGSQKFNQLSFTSKKKTYKIYYEENAIWNNRYVIEYNDKKYYCYSIEDGYIRHFPIFYEETQIGEVLKSNVVMDAKDEYCCYLKNEYEEISDGIIGLILYLDRIEYSSSYIVNKSYTITKRYSYNKTNKYYDNMWVKNNFSDEFYLKVEEDVKLAKERYKASTGKNKSFLLLILIIPWVLILGFAILFLLLNVLFG